MVAFHRQPSHKTNHPQVEVGVYEERLTTSVYNSERMNLWLSQDTETLRSRVQIYLNIDLKTQIYIALKMF